MRSCAPKTDPVHLVGGIMLLMALEWGLLNRLNDVIYTGCRTSRTDLVHCFNLFAFNT